LKQIFLQKFAATATIFVTSVIQRFFDENNFSAKNFGGACG
jgi:hypothetical protein